jgi:methionine-rich copper-binding protein CopC
VKSSTSSRLRRSLATLLVAASSLIGAAAYAHHSISSTYLEDQTVVIQGQLVQLLFRNPHSFVHIVVREKDGTNVRYAVEWGGANQLGVSGVARNTLKIGDRLIISGNPARKAENHQVRMLALHRTSDGFGWGRKPGEVVD